MGYLTFSEYKDLGGKLKKPEFNRAEFAACVKINSLTHNRLRNENPVREVVKKLVLELIERGWCGALDGEDMSSKSVSRVSVSLESNKGKAEAFIKECLAGEEIDGVPLINSGGIQFSPVVRV
jgi:hypothetical protein